MKLDFESAAISDKLKALLAIVGKVQKGGKQVKPEDIARARQHGATDKEIHDTVLIAAAFCMYNRYGVRMGWRPGLRPIPSCTVRMAGAWPRKDTSYPLKKILAQRLKRNSKRAHKVFLFGRAECVCLRPAAQDLIDRQSCRYHRDTKQRFPADYAPRPEAAWLRPTKEIPVA